MNLAVIGAGYVGLVTATVFAKFGNKVWLVDIDEKKIKDLKKGKIPFYEPGLERLIKKNTAKLFFTTNYKEAIPQTEIIFICVGTPNRNGEVELKYFFSAARSIAKNLKKPAIVVIKSTVPPGINKQIEKIMKKYTKVKFDLASCPEFLREGKALEDTLNPYRVIIGIKRKSVADKLLKLHQKISGKRLVCDTASAQLIKYASNAYLPTKISFANSISVLCDKFGADVNKVMEGMGMDGRIGPDFLSAGLGYGGSCFPKDVAALIRLAKKADYNFEILKAIQKANQVQIDYFLKKIVRLCGGSIRNKKIVVLGLAFKPETSDMREARSIYVIKGLKRRGAKVCACDPVAISEAKKILSGVRFFADPYQALKGAEALLLVTEWKDYRQLDFKKIKRLMKSPVVVDGRNIYNRKRLEKLGFIYEGIGR
ncbi:UDP-glucose/GDP-mannose dehydrogenase family protein [Patescibacteria group bacterium]|nr:UDP-glucose/GDP-mannose dehydrogenase family protein [Patescibacteria group bacterium]